MKAVLDGFTCASGRTSGSVTYTYASTVNAAAAATSRTRQKIRMSASDDDFDACTDRWRRCGVGVVHDGQRCRLDDAAGSFGNRCPRITLADDVEIDAARADVGCL